MPFPYTFPFGFDQLITVTAGIATVEGVGQPVIGEKLIFPSGIATVEGVGTPDVVLMELMAVALGHVQTRVACDGLLARLGEEIIASYNTGPSGAPIGEIVTALLVFQRKTTKITEGTIGVTGTRALSITNKSILAAFLQLQESIGGYLGVDNNWALQWPTTIGEDKGQQIRFRKNLIGITKDINYGEYCTKLHPESSDEALSDISIGPVAVNEIGIIGAYGYLTLKETYAAYKDWVEEGAGLPGHITVWKQNSAPTWKVATGVDSSPGWTDPANVIDDNWATYGKSNCVIKDVWTGYITCSIQAGHYGKCKFKWDKNVCSGSASFYLNRLEISG